MLSLPRKQSSSGVAPGAAASPFGTDATFPLVVLPGGGAEGRASFDAYVRREAGPGLTPRQALVQALAGSEFPWDAPELAEAPAGGAARQAAPAQMRVKAKLKISTRESVPPFPMTMGEPEILAEAARPGPPSMPAPAPLAPVPAWPAPTTPSPMLPIPDVSALPPAGAMATRLEPKANAPARGGASAPGERPARRFLRPLVAALLVTAIVIGGGEAWRRDRRAKAEAQAAAAAVRPPPPAPAPVVVAASAKEPSEAFRAWGRSARISGVLERENGRLRALINGRLAMDGDLVDATLELRLIGQDKAAHRLIFEERGGARLEVDY